MVEQEEGWPLGLRPLHMRVNGLVRNLDFSGSISFNTLLTGSGSPTSSTDSSSDLDTESTGSFFHDKSITLGSLLGVSSILELSTRSIRGRRAEDVKGKKKNYRSKSWLFSLCSKDSTDAMNAQSLGHFLEAERRAANDHRRNLQTPIFYESDEYARTQPVSEPNSLFVDGRVAPPQSGPWFDSDGEKQQPNRGLEENGNGYGVPVLPSCVCGQPTL